MKLRQKTLLITFFTIAVLLAGIYAVVYGLVGESVGNLEKSDLQKLVRDAKADLVDELTQIDRMLGDWASWDDTYDFIQTRSETYIKSNIEDASLAAAHIDIIGFYDLQGKLVLLRMVAREGPAPAAPQELLSPGQGSIILAQNGSGHAGGFMVLGGKLTAVALRPILTSRGEGPSRGAVLMGRYVSDAAIARLGGANSLSTAMWLAGEQMPGDVAEAWGGLVASGNESEVKNLDEMLQAGYFIASDIYGNPAAILRIESLRTGNAQVKQGMFYMLAAFVAVAIVFEALIFLLLDRFVLSRLKALGDQAGAIGKREGGLSRITVAEGDDEISRLASDMNGMLDRLGSVQRELLRSQAGYSRRLSREVKEKTRMLTGANARLRHMERIKNQFLFNIGHELKSPLAVVEMNLAAIMGRQRRKSEDFRESERMIGRNMVGLKQKIEKIIQLSRFEHSRSIRKEELDFAALVRGVAGAYRDFARVRRARIHLEGAERRAMAMGDARLLQYALGNLFSNAVKYCDERDIYARVERKGGDVVFSISNRGPGVRPENRRKLFHRFFKEDQNAPGTGVGLFMAKEIARGHSGNVWYRPNRPRGSVFYFSIPAIERGG